MKKSIFIFCTVLITFSLTAFGYMNWGHAGTEPTKKPDCSKLVLGYNYIDGLINQKYIDLVYKVEPRFNTTITKERLSRAKSILDILPKKAIQSVANYQNVQVAILHEDLEISKADKRETGSSEILNEKQIKLLQSADYSANIFISANYSRKNAVSGEVEYGYLPYYITIVPEKETEYATGNDAFVQYIKENLQQEAAIIQEDQLKPGKVVFTVTREGTIADVQLTSTSGYPSVDEALVELIANTPGKWQPASNSAGEKVEQKLVFFFGLEGC